MIGSSSHRSGLKVSGSGKREVVRWRLKIEVPIGVPAGMRWVYEVRGLVYVISSLEIRGERDERL